MRPLAKWEGGATAIIFRCDMPIVDLSYMHVYPSFQAVKIFLCRSNGYIITFSAVREVS